MKRTHLPLNALRVFEAAARHLSFTRAADELAVTPAAVGQHIRALEDVLGLVLFKRTARALVLTPEAERALPALREGFEKFEDAVRLMQAAQATSVLTLSVPPYFAAKWLIPKLSSFYASRPNMQLRIMAADKMADFTQENIDLAIVYATSEFTREGTALRSQKLMDEEIIIVAAPALAATIKSPGDLSAALLIHDDSVAEGWPQWLTTNTIERPNPGHTLHVNMTSLAIDAAAAGQGVALIQKHLADLDMIAGRLVQLFEKSYFNTNFSYYLVAPEPQWRQKKVQDFNTWIMTLDT